MDRHIVDEQALGPQSRKTPSMDRTIPPKTATSAKSQRRVLKPQPIGYAQLNPLDGSDNTHLLQKLIRELAHKRVTILRVAVHEVDKSTTLRVLRAPMKSIEDRQECHGAVPLAASTQTLII